VARLAQPLQMKVIAWSPNLTAERLASSPTPIGYVPSLNELMAQSDFVSIQMVLSPSTKEIITAEALSHMKPTAIFLNTSRGQLVDEPALIKVLEEKKIAGAALDVYYEEPLPDPHPLRKLDNVLLSPHMGYVEHDNYKVFFTDTVENVQKFLEGQPTRVM